MAGLDDKISEEIEQLKRDIVRIGEGNADGNYQVRSAEATDPPSSEFGIRGCCWVWDAAVRARDGRMARAASLSARSARPPASALGGPVAPATLRRPY